jgi:hypothetical protein
MSKRTIYVLHLMTLIIFSILISSFFLMEKENEKEYTPPVYNGEKVIPVHFDEKN